MDPEWFSLEAKPWCSARSRLVGAGEVQQYHGSAGTCTSGAPGDTATGREGAVARRKMSWCMRSLVVSLTSSIRTQIWLN